MKIQVIGPGCPKCRQLAENVAAAVAAAGVACEVEKVTDLKAIIALGVPMTPALRIDGQLAAVGNVPTVEEIRKMLR